jgi:HEAT repeat protein
MSIDNRYKYGALSIGVILGLLAIAIYSGSEATDASSEDPSTATRQDAPPPATPSAAASGASWRDAENQWHPPKLHGRYALEYRMEMGVSGQAPMLAYKLGGELTVIEDSEAAWSLATLQDVELEATGQTAGMTDLPADKPERAFMHPLRAKYDSDGALQEVLFAPEVPQSARATMHGILASAQLVATQDTQEKQTWVQREQDTNEHYKATYTRAGGDLIEKRMAANTDGEGPKVFVATGDAVFTVKTSERIDDLRYEQDARIDVTATGQRVLRVQTEIKLTYLGEPLDTTFTQAALSANRAYNRSAHAKSDPEAEDRAMVAGRSFEQLTQAVTKASREEVWQKRTIARRDLSAMLRLEPERAEAIGEKLRAGSEHPDVQRSYVEALVGASTPEAQHQLASIVSDREADRGLREQIIQGAGFVGAPTPELVTAIVALSKSEEEPASTQEGSLVALGALVGNLGDSDSDAQQEQLDNLLDRADKRLTVDAFAQEFGKQGEAGEERNIVRWLEALGNTRSEEILPILDRATQTESAWIKSTAYLAMRHLKSEKATQLVTYGVLHEWDSNVRVKAVEAARILGHDRMLEPCKQALFQDKSKLVRLEAAFAIVSWSNDHPEVLAILEAAIENEPELMVRETLRNYTQPNRNLQEKRSGPSDFQ